MKLFLMFILISFSVLAAAKGSVTVATEDQNGVRWIDLYAKGIPAVYGMELEIFYPNIGLDIADTDSDKSGSQILKGSFFSESSYEIANNVDVRNGRIRYAVRLLKPAEAIEGDGHLARVGFLSREGMSAEIEISNIKFGTQSGEVITVPFPSKVLVEPAFSVVQESISNGLKPVTRKLGVSNRNSTEGNTYEGQGNNLVIIGFLGFIGLLLLLVIILLLRRKS